MLRYYTLIIINTFMLAVSSGLSFDILSKRFIEFIFEFITNGDCV